MAGAYRTLPKPEIPGATAAATIVIRIGSALGAAVFAIVLQARTRATSLPDAFGDTFWWAFAIAALALLPALMIPRTR